MLTSAAPRAAFKQHTLAVLTALLTLTGAGLAEAANFSGPITVTLSAPGGTTSDGGATLASGPINLSDIIAPTLTITPGDGSNVGSFMLTGESISFSGTSIMVHVAEGSFDGIKGTTGYLGAGGVHASYTFGGLNVTGAIITGLSYTLADGFTGAAGNGGVANAAALAAAHAVQLASPHSVVLQLDQIQFADRGHGSSNNFADFRIDLQTAAVPEPGSSALALAGLAAIALAIGRRSRPKA